MSEVSSTVANMAAPVSASSTPALVAGAPALTSNSKLNLGDFAAQLLEDLAPAASDAIGVGVDALLSTVPMGSLITDFIGPHTISGYVSQALTALEGQVEAGNVPVDSSNFVITTATSLFNTNEAKLASFLGTSVGPTISALVAKIKF